MKTALRIIISLLVLLSAVILPCRAYAEDSSILDGYTAEIPDEIDNELAGMGITPVNVDTDSLSVDKVINNIIEMLKNSISSPL